MQFKGNTDQSSARYWDDLAGLYQKETRISTGDFHYGPLLPGDSVLGLLPPVPQRSCFQCLEIGCGAGQNSIFLAKQGARCMATDISEKQLAHGRKLANDEKVEVDFRRVSMDAMSDLGKFDLIHSTYALPFSADPQKVIADAAAMLKPDGIFLLTRWTPKASIPIRRRDRKTTSSRSAAGSSAHSGPVNPAAVPVKRFAESIQPQEDLRS
jgi:2-polyprenyl-3-methyl-5-hydroxy-6-metoxy-1,4-benzoquinol methylase